MKKRCYLTGVKEHKYDLEQLLEKENLALGAENS